MKKAVVLVVEKDRSLVADAIGALQEAGYEVVEAVDAADGLKKLYISNPDVVIASTNLPSVNGEDACQRLRQASYLPLIAIGSRDEVVDMLELGVDACVIKPPSGREVVARVDSLLRRQGDDDTSQGSGRLTIEDYLPLSAPSTLPSMLSTSTSISTERISLALQPSLSPSAADRSDSLMTKDCPSARRD